MINDTSLSCCKVVGYAWGWMVVVFMAQLVLVSLDSMHLVFFLPAKDGASRKLVASCGIRKEAVGGYRPHSTQCPATGLHLLLMVSKQHG